MELLVYRYQRPVFNAAMRVTGDQEEAKDVTQVVFMKAFEKLGSFDPSRRFFSWIYRIAVNESLNRVRSNGREVTDDHSVDEAPSSENTDPERIVGRQETDAVVQSALMRLRVDDRVIIMLRHFSDCSYRDIAEILDIPEKTVKSRLFTARQRLQTVLDDEEMR